MSNQLIKSPLNYTGGKFKLLPQILPLFPEKIDCFIDLFGGGFNVGININANCIIYNDINEQIVEMLQYFNGSHIERLLFIFDSIIKEYELSKTNKEGYLRLRNDYNKNNIAYNHALVLYMLVCHSFNNQIRFNSKGEFNMPFGERCFNDILKERFIEFINTLHNKNCFFWCHDFKVFFNNILLNTDNTNTLIYLDPPYLAGSIATYNENGGWTIVDEKSLLNLADRFNENKIKFALSNVLEHKGEKNELLIEWSKKYNIHYLEKDYNSCSHHLKNKKSHTVEVLITNY